jgi:hypothetical protein
VCSFNVRLDIDLGEGVPATLPLPDFSSDLRLMAFHRAGDAGFALQNDAFLGCKVF